MSFNNQKNPNQGIQTGRDKESPQKPGTGGTQGDKPQRPDQERSAQGNKPGQGSYGEKSGWKSPSKEDEEETVKKDKPGQDVEGK